ncbi:MAG: S41 family peptidase [Saprospiraceae bacterium]
MKKKHSFILLSILWVLTISSCGKWFIGGNPKNTPMINYQYFYDAVKTNYSFFAEKAVSWDSLDRIYRPMVHDSLSNDSLYHILATMLHTLQDGHVNLYINHNRSRNADWYLDYPSNFNRDFVHRVYWGKDYETSGALVNTWIDSVGYVYYGSFSSGFSKGNLNYVLNKFADAKGLIIDVRNNGGGAMSNMFKLCERFVPEKTWMGMLQYKTGPGTSDFSQPDSIFVKPLIDYKKKAEEEAKKKKKAKEEDTPQDSISIKRTGAGQWMVQDTATMMLNKPIVLLVNRHSYSATNFFAAFMSTLPNVTLIGDRSGGGGGIPVSFELPNGWTFRLSATRTWLPDGTDIETGIAPDIYQNTGPEDELQGVDAIIEKAKTHILGISTGPQ